MTEYSPLYSYDGCAITAGYWSDDPWDDEDHIYYEYYNDGDLICLYLGEEMYEHCYAYYKISDYVWEFAPGGVWIWSNCGEQTEEKDPDCDRGDWDKGRDEWHY